MSTSDRSSSGSSSVSIDMDDVFGLDEIDNKKIEGRFLTPMEKNQASTFRSDRLAKEKERRRQKAFAENYRAKNEPVNHKRLAEKLFEVKYRPVDAPSLAEKLSSIETEEEGWAKSDFIPAIKADGNRSSELTSLASQTPSHTPSVNDVVSVSNQSSGYTTPSDDVIQARIKKLQALAKKLDQKLSSLPKGQKRNELSLVVRGLEDPEQQRVLAHLIDVNKKFPLTIKKFNQRHGTDWKPNDFYRINSHINTNTDMHIGQIAEDRTANNKLFIAHMQGKKNPVPELIEKWEKENPEHPLSTTLISLLAKYNKTAPPEKQIGYKGPVSAILTSAHDERKQAKDFLKRPDIVAMGNQHQKKFEAYQLEYPDTKVVLSIFRDWSSGKR